ncbi:mobile mystery protein B [Pseudomonas sp. FP818]|uniref:mobile mystery protein B n=1 Tax=Pseudomonas sp. FP818 TaxID=2954099 RepID=UPI002736E3BF|nr:mobile mystery protein B [Pseudomonas sp. FP818]MDZ4300907.1 mobile mystery protein B [Pseudomonas sp.]WLI34421.1 mobile mystery protein B [Pseudomonas sp. FP818]
MGSIVAIVLELKPGQTPLDPDEVAGLKPRHITTQGELDEWEAANILKAMRWLGRQNKLDVLNEHFCRQLHVRMFSDTWKWAGTFRHSDKNIGCDWTKISVNLRHLLDNTTYWLEHDVLAGTRCIPVRRGCCPLPSPTGFTAPIPQWQRSPRALDG